MGTVHTSVAGDSVDGEGISTITSTRSAADSRRGQIYAPADLAAVAPVHLHPIRPGYYLMVFSRRWHTATSGASLGWYSDHTEDLAPGWVVVESGGSRRAPGHSLSIPGPPDRTLVAACSRGNTYLYLLSHTPTGSLIQHLRYSPDRDMMLPVVQEALPPRDGIVFDRGLYLSGRHLVLVGSDEDGQVHLARKHWGKVGTNATTGKPGGDEVDDSSWEYATVDGWSRDPDELAPIPDILTAGPVSVAYYRDRYYMSTVAADGDERTGRIWTRRLGGTWTPMPAPVALGSVADGTYLGGTVQFQQHVLTKAVTPAVPYVTATREVDGPDERISVVWDILPMQW